MNKIIKKFFLYLDKTLEKKNVKIITKILGNKLNVVLDVGAHNGETINFLNKNFKIYKIYSFEPNPSGVQSVKKQNIANNEIYELAISNIKDEIELNIGYFSSMSTFSKINDKSFYTKVKKIIIWLSFGKFKIYEKKILVKAIRLEDFIKEKKIKEIDLLKIDTEGHELNVIQGTGEYLKNIKLILFEHHYDDSLIKNYGFSDIDNYLKSQNFELVSKFSMKLRKGYELIYLNNRYAKF